MMTRIAQAVEGIGHSFDRTAILDEDCLHTYDLLAEGVELLAEELVAAGLRGGDRVAVYIHFGYAGLLAALAVNYAGAVAIPLDIRETCAVTERKLRVAGAHWVLGHVTDDHIVEEIAGREDPLTVSVAEAYTLIGLPSAAARSGAGFAFCTPEGFACRAVDTEVLADTARTVARQWDIDADDTVALGPDLGEFEAFLAASAALVSGATLCLAEAGEQWDSASVLVQAERGSDTPPPGDRPVVARLGRVPARESAGYEVRESRLPARPQRFADTPQIRRCG
ncbi:AMP-binding protein [Nocardia sp. NPDC050712]|uniref:AMP-binding protein n=1 Tax=Nocardia sp. NPDC050712 TaxID=3155518 RepID=UPI0033EAD192